MNLTLKGEYHKFLNSALSLFSGLKGRKWRNEGYSRGEVFLSRCKTISSEFNLEAICYANWLKKMCCQVFETKSTIESEAYMIKRPLYYRRIEFDPFLENLFLRFKFYHFGNITLRHQPQVPASHQLGTVGRYYVTIMISKLCVTNVSKIVAIADHRSPITQIHHWT